MAVLPVVAYHVGLSQVPGGFVGVDVFFVISGYLITQLLDADLQAGKFSLLQFYERRIRRIGPVLVATLAVTFALGLLLCLPDELTELAKSVAAATASASNFYFWITSGYFNPDASTKPLMHTWSLAVEEQFYLAWPIYLFLARRYLQGYLVAVTAIVALASLVLSAYGAFRFPSATFFLPATRLWELATGGLIALGVIPAIKGGTVRNVLAAAGLLLIIGSVLVIRASMPFPGLLAVPPCLGAALIITAGRHGDSLVSRGLATPVCTFVGAISYSLYMWHWPITVFQKHYSLLATGLTQTQNAVLILGVSFVVAVLSWKWIEQPFRTGRLGTTRGGLMQLSGVSVVILLAVSSIAWENNGFPSRFSPKELRALGHLRLTTVEQWRTDQCFLYDKQTEWRLAPECLRVSSERKNYLLLGDSHAAELWSGFQTVFTDVNFLQASATNCFPTITHAVTESTKCTAVIDSVMRDFLPNAHVDQVLLSARWTEASLEAVGATLDWMKEHRIPVMLLGPTAVYDAPVPRLVVFALRAADPELLSRHLDSGIAALDAQMARLAAAHDVPYISLLRLECTRAPCSTADGSEEWPELFDQEHFNIAGSQSIARKVSAAYPSFGS